MSRRTFQVALTLLLAVGLLLPAFAKPIKTSFEVFEKTTIAGTELKPGVYRLEADETTFKVLRDKRVVVEGTATWANCAKQSQTALVRSGEAVTEIRIKGQDRCLTFAK
jgi:hypothetical protein